MFFLFNFFFPSQTVVKIISRSGQSQGLLYNNLCHSLIHSVIQSFSHPFVKISLRRRHAQTVKNGAPCHKTNYIDIFPEIISLEGQFNSCVGSKVKVIWLNGWILPTGWVALGMPWSLRSRLVLKEKKKLFWVCIIKSTFKTEFKCGIIFSAASYKNC